MFTVNEDMDSLPRDDFHCLCDLLNVPNGLASASASNGQKK